MHTFARLPTRTRDRGFTLAEIAVVLLIIMFLLGGLLLTLPAQIESRRVAETRRTLADVGEALMGFAASQGRLPCPAKANLVTDTGVESPSGGGTCTNPYDGFVPGSTLGISPTDDAGFVIDAWGQRLRYAVSRDPTNGTLSSNATSTPRWSFTSPNGMRNTIAGAGCAVGAGIGCLHPDLQVCAGGAPTAQQTCAATALSDGAIAVWYSIGSNGTTGGTGSDESNNPNPNVTYANDRVYISHEPTAATATGGEFDDLVAWLSPNIFYNRMIAAGRLP